MVEPKKEEVVESLSTTLSPYDALHAYVAKKVRARLTSSPPWKGEGSPPEGS
ncbi:hypothetical protein [Sulfuracidifex metallicus]|uniref:hypothetical protein n=1 Tax=Sulfuracidifex metallicus TaxID=47303 RepID=UPI0012DEBCEC|nr:hypothetical protein [Sulfuracidifex metallicus]WOE52022.1 hypothetical protein RQ359_001471 [Sulfuracidifex metallicus DSM 6482 = JCM 9184]